MNPQQLRYFAWLLASSHNGPITVARLRATWQASMPRMHRSNMVYLLNIGDNYPPNTTSYTDAELRDRCGWLPTPGDYAAAVRVLETDNAIWQ